ncbi:hypothetical protein BSKO_09137 [Bryopsis sp. KO-2023]|nr:hypothetical protein BSKO_09137 [Bryopsis sp. KO-2023]
MLSLHVAVVVGLLCGLATAQQFFPESCAGTCTGPENFATSLPKGPTGTGTRPSEWTIVTLNQIKANLGTTSPPGVGRALAIVSTCMYEAVSLFEAEGLQPWAVRDFKKIGGGTEQMNYAIDGAALTALQSLFSGFTSFSSVVQALQTINSSEDVRSLFSKEEASAMKDAARAQAEQGFDTLSTKMALALGAAACDDVIAKFSRDGYDGLARPLPNTEAVELDSVNFPQVLSGITNCDREMVDLDKWQALCTPKEKKSLADVGSKNCKVQKWLAPWGGGMTTFAILAGTPFEGRELISRVAAVDSTVLH